MTPPPSALAGLSCTIAVSGAWASGSGGFLTFPGAHFKPDPTSAVLTPDGNFLGLTHVLALQRWVAVPRDWVTPDGTRYVYLSWIWSGQQLQVVNGNTRISALPLPMVSTASGARLNVTMKLLSADSGGIYLATDSYLGTPGLYRVAYDGQARKIASDGFWQAVGFGYAYGEVTASVPDGAANTIFRQSLADGSRQDVFSAPGLAANVVGFDADGNPVAEARSSQLVEVWLARPGGPVKLLSAQIQAPAGGMGPGAGPQPLHVYSAIGDSHGLWLATTQGLYLYTAQAGLEAASSMAGPLGSTCR